MYISYALISHMSAVNALLEYLNSPTCFRPVSFLLSRQVFLCDVSYDSSSDNEYLPPSPFFQPQEVEWSGDRPRKMEDCVGDSVTSYEVIFKKICPVEFACFSRDCEVLMSSHI